VERVRSKPSKWWLPSHDTTGLEFAGDGRTGLGPMLKSERGFYAHFSLAVNPDDDMNRLDPQLHPGHPEGEGGRGRQRTARVVQSDPEKEYLRWAKGIDEVERQLAGSSVSSMWPIARATRTKSFGDALERSWIRTAAQIRSNLIAATEVTKLYESQTAQGLPREEVPLAFARTTKSQGP